MSEDKSARSWTVHARDTLYEGFNRLERLSFSHSSHTGETVGPVERELFVRGDVVGLIVVDPVRDAIALVEQFRYGALAREPDPWLLEVIAGMIDTDESPAEVAIREAREEAGIELDHVELACRYWTSPGCSSETVSLFYAETDLAGIGGVHGLAEESEDIRVHVVSIDQALAWLAEGRICNSLSIIALQHVQLRRLQSHA